MAAPAGWERVEAVFAWTVAVQTWDIVYSAGGGSVRGEPTTDALELVQLQRESTVPTPAGPWWRMRLVLTNAGEIRTDYDYGDEPFPDHQLFPPEAYQADLREYPRRRLPMWLAAYVGHAGRQQRSPRIAAEQARADRARGVVGQPATDLPELPALWARWAVLAATFVAAEAQQGPRVLPSLGWFESADRSGSTLYLLPGNRAILSGGVWNAPELDAAYNDGAPLPELYAGAPDWVVDAVLNPRAGSGMLSFCSWWDNGRWYRGESPSASNLTTAIPGVWSAQVTAEIIEGVLAGVTGEAVSGPPRSAVATLVSAAEAGVVTFDTVAAVFDPSRFDADAALGQFSFAGLRAFT